MSIALITGSCGLVGSESAQFFSRKGFDTKAKKSVIIKHLKSKNIKFLKNAQIDVSSTQLRNKIINGS